MIESLLSGALGKGLPSSVGQGIAKAREAQSAPAPSNGLSTAQNKLIDQVDIGEGVTKRLADLQNLDRQLTRFLDVLKGNRSADSVIAELNSERGIGGIIAGNESRSALNISQIESIRETTSLTADISEEGNLDLVLTNVRETLSQSNFSLSTQQNNFFASFS